MPKIILTLPALGLPEAERFCTELIEYQLDPYKVQQNIPHDMIAQKLTVSRLKTGQIISFMTELQMAEKSTADKKPLFSAAHNLCPQET